MFLRTPCLSSGARVEGDVPAGIPGQLGVVFCPILSSFCSSGYLLISCLCENRQRLMSVLLVICKASSVKSS